MDGPDVLRESGPPVASRPMPSLPGARPPLLPDKNPYGNNFRPVPQRRSVVTKTGVPVRPAPTRPGPPLPVPHKPAAPLNSHQNTPSQQNRNSVGGRQRPVITVLDARPMTEVGFRDIHTVPGSGGASASRPRDIEDPGRMAQGSGAAAGLHPAAASSGSSPAENSVPRRTGPPTRPPSFRRSMPPVGEGGNMAPAYDPDRTLPVPPRPAPSTAKNPALSLLASVLAPAKSDRQESPASDSQDLLVNTVDKDPSAFVNDGFDTASAHSDQSAAQSSASHENTNDENLFDIATPADAQPALIDFAPDENIAPPNDISRNIVSIDWGGSGDEPPPIPPRSSGDDSFDVNFTESTLPASADDQIAVSDKDILATMHADAVSDSEQREYEEESDQVSSHAKMGGIAVLPAELLGAALARRSPRSPRSSIGDDASSNKSSSPRASPAMDRRRPHSYAFPGSPPDVHEPQDWNDDGVNFDHPVASKPPPPPTPTKPKNAFLAELNRTLGKPPGPPEPEPEPEPVLGQSEAHVVEDVYAVPHKVAKRPEQNQAAHPAIPRSATFPVHTTQNKAKPPPPIKPKPSLMPKPSLKPKPSVKAKPAVTPVQKSAPSPENISDKSDTNKNEAAPSGKPNYSYSGGRNRLSALIQDMEHKSSSSGASEPPKFGSGNLKPRTSQKSESSDEQAPNDQNTEPASTTAISATSKRPGPMKATYRPTIIRPSASAPDKKEEEEKVDPGPMLSSMGGSRSQSVSNLSQRFNQAGSESGPGKTAPVSRRKPTIIRAGSRNSMIQSSTTPSEPVKAAEVPRPRPRSMMSAAMSMPNIAKAVADDEECTVIGPAASAGPPEVRNGPSGERRESTGAPPPRPAPRRQTPPASPTPARNRVSQAIVQPNVLSELRRNFDEPEVPFPLADPPKGSEVKRIGPAKPPPPKAGPARPATPPANRKSPPAALGAADTKSQRPPRPGSGPPPRPASGPKVSPGSKTTGPTGFPPNLPNRPGPGHPLFHYVVSGPHGIALFDYASDQSGDLNFKAGDTIMLIEEVGGDWLRGKVGSSEGIFPANFLDIVEPLPKNAASRAPAKPSSPVARDSPGSVSGSGPRCLARFDYDGEEHDDLRFRSGDVIRILEHVGDDWLRGEVNGSQGMFPIAFVEIVEDLPKSSTTAHTTNGGSPAQFENIVNALHDFNGESDELSFIVGEKITVLSKLDSIWLYGEIGSRRGTFPSNFVDRSPPNLPDYVKEPAPQRPTAPPPAAAYCVAMYQFPGEADGDLPFEEGDKITLLERVDADWLKGSVHGKTGVFPSGFVNILKDLDTTDALPQRPVSSPAAPTKVPCGTALYDFDGETADDLSFRLGDSIELVEQIDSNWIKGKFNGKVGMFPANFVEIVNPF